MGVYADSSPDLFDDPKVETVVELLKRIWVRKYWKIAVLSKLIGI